MSSPQAVANVLMGGGALNKTGKKTIICKAFNRAAKRWCAGEGKGKGRKFNDFFYEELRKDPPLGDPSLARELTREGAALFQGGKFIGMATDLAGAGGAAGSVASAMVGAVGNALGGMGYAAGATEATGWLAAAGNKGVDAIRWAQMQAKWGTPGGGAFNTRYLDGQFADGTVLELKGPDDNYKDPGEAVDQKKVNGGNPAVASCKSCNSTACSNEGTSNGMKVWRCS